MQIIDVDLKEEYPDVIHESVYLSGILFDETWELENSKRKAVLVLPGGGYDFISYREKDPIMVAFLAQGFHAFSLSYSCKRKYPLPYIEVACAMHYINSHIEEFNLLPNQVSLVGFSAGGHLACTYGYLYKRFAEDNEEKRMLKPYSIILGYPVTSLLKSENDGCKYNISHNESNIVKLLSADLHITHDYPPTFIWATANDKAVDCNNSKWLANELKKKKVKNKCIIYPNGPHGLALANHATDNEKKSWNNKNVSEWIKLASDFIYSI